jgi:hypothetical protein
MNSSEKEAKTRVYNEFFNSYKKASINMGTRDLIFISQFYPKISTTDTIRRRFKNIQERIKSLNNKLAEHNKLEPDSIFRNLHVDYDVKKEELNDSLAKEINKTRKLQEELESMRVKINTVYDKYQQVCVEANRHSENMTQAMKVSGYKKTFGSTTLFASVVTDDDFIMLDEKPLKSSAILEICLAAAWKFDNKCFSEGYKILEILYNHLGGQYYKQLVSKIKWPNLWKDFYDDMLLSMD